MLHSPVICFFRILLLVFSFYGYAQFISKKIAVDFSAAVLFSSFGCIMFFAGILNILREASVLLCLGGVVLGVRSILARETPKKLLSKGTVFFVLVSIYLAFLLYGRKFIHYDDFSHWALVVKQIVTFSKFPNFDSYGILFPSYPLGSASFIYYFAKLSGIESEWFYMLSQSMLVAAFLSSLFAFSKNRLSDIITAAAALFMLVGNVNPVNLLVDTLLPCAAIAGIAFCVYYRDCIKDKCLYLIPFTVFIVSVKNSGIFFAAVIVLYALFCGRKTLRANIVRWASVAAAPFLSVYLWQRHVDMVFDHGMNSKHAMDLKSYSTLFSQKSGSSISDIIVSVSKHFFSLENPVLWFIVFELLLFLIIKILPPKKEYHAELPLLALISLIGYEIGLVGMYIFSMPDYEASYLAGYDRYYRTIIIFITALLLIHTVGIVNESETKSRKAVLPIAVSLLFALSSYLCVNPNLKLYTQKYEPGKREKFDRLIESYDIPVGKSYIVTLTEEDSGYLEFMTGYLLSPEKSAITGEKWLSENPAELANYDYLIIIDRNEGIDSFLQEHFPDRNDEVFALGEAYAAPAV